MATNLVINGVSYSFPTVNDVNWGANVTSWATAITNGVLQKSGGSFQLLAEVDFGTSFGVKSLYLKSRSVNPSVTGIIRLANLDKVSFRDVGNTADLGFTLNGSDLFAFDAGISAPSLTTAGAITTPLSTGIVHSTAGVFSSSLIVDADVDPAAAIARSKLASGSASHVVVNDGSGVMSSEAQLAVTRGGTGLSSTSTGDILYGSASNVYSSLPIGSTNQVLTVVGGVPTWQNNAAGFADPMTTAGDMIYRNGSNVTTRLPRGSAGQLLMSDGTTPIYTDTITGNKEFSGMVTLAGSTTTAGTNKINLGSGGTANRLDIRGQNTFRLGISTASLSADQILTAPNVTGTIITTGDTGTVTSTMIADGTIVNADISASAAIDGSKIVSASGSVSGVVTTGTQTLAGAKTFSGITTISNTTASTSPTTGALVVSGGAGLAGSIYTSGPDIFVGYNRGSAGAASIGFISQASGTVSDGYISRNSGANGTLQIIQRGTGAIQLVNVSGTGTGDGVQVQGLRTSTVLTTTPGAAYGAAAGYVGEILESTWATTTGYTADTTVNLGSVTLTPGLWKIVVTMVTSNNGTASGTGEVSCSPSLGASLTLDAAWRVNKTALTGASDNTFTQSTAVYVVTSNTTCYGVGYIRRLAGTVQIVGDSTLTRASKIVAVRIA